MNSKWFLIVNFFLLSFSTSILAQKGKIVEGKFIDSTQNPLIGITVKLFFPGSKDTLKTLTGKKGSFGFTAVKSPIFFIRASSSEYSEFEQEYKFDESIKNIQLGEIILHQVIKVLQEVTIGLPFISIREDTIAYRADSIQLREDASVEDLLKNLPGIKVNKNGTITAQGKLVSKIKVNGKDYFGTDVKMATRELPANIVDKIQVIDDYGEEAAHTGIKSGDPVKVINLKLKKDKNNGVFGNVEAGYGTSESYQAKASINFFNDKSQLSFYGNSNNINNGFVITNTGNSGMSGIQLAGGGTGTGTGNTGGMLNSGNAGVTGNNTGIPEGITTSYSAATNFRFDLGKSNSLDGSYSYGNRNTQGFREIIQQNFYPAERIVNNQRFDYSRNSDNHTMYLNLELNPDSLSNLKISPEISFYHSKNKNGSVFYFLRDSVYRTSEGSLKDTSNTSNPGFGVNLNYNRRFKKKGRNLNLSLSIGTNQSNMETTRYGFTRVFGLQGNYYDSTQNQNIGEDNSALNYKLNVTYTEPLGKNRFADITYFQDFSKSDIDRNVFIPGTGPGSFIPDSSLSNQFTNRFINERIGINFRTMEKKYNYSLGLGILPINNKTYSVEKDSVSQKQKFINIAPTARFNFPFSKANNLVIVYNGMNRQPAFLQLQPVRDISNPQFQREGNPGLKPEFRHTVSLSFNGFNLKTGSSIFSSLNFTAVSNRIINNTTLLDSGGAQLNRPENINGVYAIGGFYSYSKPWENNKYTLVLNGSFNYGHDAMLVNSIRSTGNNWLLVQGIQFTLANNKSLEFGVEVNYSLNASRNLINRLNNFTFSTWTIGNNVSIFLPASIVIKYDFEKLFNKGLSGTFNNDINLLNITIEKKLIKKKSFYLSFSGFNVLNQNSSVSREVYGNSITDIRYLQLSRYYLFKLLYRWNKFSAGK
jgi:hypothetical protein